MRRANFHPSLKVRAIAVAFLLIVGGILFAVEPYLVFRFRPDSPWDSAAELRRVFALRTMSIEVLCFLTALLLAPAAKSGRLLSLRSRAIALGCVSLAMAVFIFYFGNQQFGAWDFGCLIDTGWRQVLGQRPYVDFITPNPPAFNLGIYWAFRVFGVNWNAQIFAIIIFAVATFLWMYWLLRRFSASPEASLFTAFTVEAVTVLSVCFWWYNDTTAVMAAIFFLSAGLCAWRAIAAPVPNRTTEWVSYAISLGLLSLMKPNTAGLLLFPTVFLLFIIEYSWRRVAAFTLLGSAFTILLLLANHVSIAAMLASYRAASIERGGLNTFGIAGLSVKGKVILFLWTSVLASPLCYLLPRIRTASRNAQWRVLAFLSLLLFAVPLTLYGMATNNDFKDSETSVLIVACALVSLVFRWTGGKVRMAFLAFLVALVGANLYYGISRQRVFGIGNHAFYQYGAADVPVRDGFFRDLESTRHFADVQAEIARAKTSFPGPVFLGPRLEFDNAVFRIPSPNHWPIYYQPGTSVARKDISHLTQVWKCHDFTTLVFLKNDRTFYPDELLNAINENYVQQFGFNDIDVYVRRGDSVPCRI